MRRRSRDLRVLGGAFTFAPVPKDWRLRRRWWVAQTPRRRFGLFIDNKQAYPWRPTVGRNKYGRVRTVACGPFFATRAARRRGSLDDGSDGYVEVGRPRRGKVAL